MEINFNTDKLVILNYPAEAGGKFISLCLSLEKNFLHQHKTLAELKIKGKINSFLISKSVLDNSKFKDTHFELGCVKLSGFNSFYNKKEQINCANNFWKRITNQNQFYFCMVDPYGDSWNHYPNAIHIVFKNYEWILTERQKKIIL